MAGELILPILGYMRESNRISEYDQLNEDIDNGVVPQSQMYEKMSAIDPKWIPAANDQRSVNLADGYDIHGNLPQTANGALAQLPQQPPSGAGTIAGSTTDNISGNASAPTGALAALSQPQTQQQPTDNISGMQPTGTSVQQGALASLNGQPPKAQPMSYIDAQKMFVRNGVSPATQQQYLASRLQQIQSDYFSNPDVQKLPQMQQLAGLPTYVAAKTGDIALAQKMPGMILDMQQKGAAINKDNAQAGEAQANAAKATAGLPPGYSGVGGSSINGTQGNGQQQSFGFPIPQLNTEAYKEAVTTDAAQQKAANANLPYMSNARSILRDLEPNLNNYPTGGPGKHLYQDLIGTLDPNGAEATAGANIEKNTSDLATQLGNFQRAPGSRSSDLQLQNIIASKPSITQPVQTNKNIVATLKARMDDYDLSSELQQKYREASPIHITDSNTDLLDNALKQKFPLTSVDPKTGNVTYNPQNVQAIREAIPDAIANPDKYMKGNNIPVTQPTLTPYQQSLLQEAQKRKIAAGGGN